MISCSNSEDELLISSEGPPAFPHVFMGNAYVNGQPIKEGIVIYAEFGNSQSEIVETLYGRYLNVLVAPKYKSELTSEVNFYIENDKGDKIKSIENFKLSSVAKFSLSCFTVLAPIKAEVIARLFNTQAIAICDKD